MTTELDTLATALYVRTGDLLKESPHLAPQRPEAGIFPQLGDAELITLAVMQPLLGFKSEARWVRYAHAHLRHGEVTPGLASVVAAVLDHAKHPVASVALP